MTSFPLMAWLASAMVRASYAQQVASSIPAVRFRVSTLSTYQPSIQTDCQSKLFGWEHMPNMTLKIFNKSKNVK